MPLIDISETRRSRAIQHTRGIITGERVFMVRTTADLAETYVGIPQLGAPWPNTQIGDPVMRAVRIQTEPLVPGVPHTLNFATTARSEVVVYYSSEAIPTPGLICVKLEYVGKQVRTQTDIFGCRVGKFKEPGGDVLVGQTHVMVTRYYDVSDAQSVARNCDRMVGRVNEGAIYLPLTSLSAPHAPGVAPNIGEAPWVRYADRQLLYLGSSPFEAVASGVIMAEHSFLADDLRIRHDLVFPLAGEDDILVLPIEIKRNVMHHASPLDQFLRLYPWPLDATFAAIVASIDATAPYFTAPVPFDFMPGQPTGTCPFGEPAGADPLGPPP